jgi:DNA-binding protein
MFRALPPEVRDRLHDLPAVLAALRERAEQLRVTDAEGEGVSNAVAAMEAVRLDLMGMGAGVRSVPDVTRNLEEARRLAERMAAARPGNPSPPLRASGQETVP